MSRCAVLVPWTVLWSVDHASNWDPSRRMAKYVLFLRQRKTLTFAYSFASLRSCQFCILQCVNTIPQFCVLRRSKWYAYLAYSSASPKDRRFMHMFRTEWRLFRTIWTSRPKPLQCAHWSDYGSFTCSWRSNNLRSGPHQLELQSSWRLQSSYSTYPLNPLLSTFFTSSPSDLIPSRC